MLRELQVTHQLLADGILVFLQEVFDLVLDIGGKVLHNERLASKPRQREVLLLVVVLDHLVQEAALLCVCGQEDLDARHHSGYQQNGNTRARQHTFRPSL